MDSKNYKYAIALLANLVLIVPLVKFLIWPESSPQEFVDNIEYLLIAKMLSFPVAMQLNSLHKSWSTVRGIVIIGPLMWILYSQAGYFSILYLLANTLVDFVLVHTKGDMAKIEQVLNAANRLILFILLMMVVSVLGLLVDRSHFDTLLTRNGGFIANYQAIGDLIGTALMLIFYYILEPFATPLMEHGTNPKSKINKYLKKRFG